LRPAEHPLERRDADGGSGQRRHLARHQLAGGRRGVHLAAAARPAGRLAPSLPQPQGPPLKPRPSRVLEWRGGHPSRGRRATPTSPVPAVPGAPTPLTNPVTLAGRPPHPWVRRFSPSPGGRSPPLWPSSSVHRGGRPLPPPPP